VKHAWCFAPYNFDLLTPEQWFEELPSFFVQNEGKHYGAKLMLSSEEITADKQNIFIVLLLSI
jgi:hypothetical protein